MLQLLIVISMSVHASISVSAIVLNLYVLYLWNFSLFRRRKDYFIIVVITAVNLVKCILPADVSIEFLMTLLLDRSSSPGPLSTRLQCLVDFRAATLTTVYFFHGFFLAWLAVERLHTLRNPLKAPITPLFHSVIIFILAVFSSGMYLTCYIDAVVHNPETEIGTCALGGILGPRLLYPIMGFRIFSITIALGIYPFLIFGLRNLRRNFSEQQFRIRRGTYKITVTLCISLVFDLTVEFGPDIIAFFGLVPLEYYTFVQNVYLSRSLMEPVLFLLRSLTIGFYENGT